MTFPEFDENGDLPVGIYRATLEEILEHFGQDSLQRQLVARRLERIYFSAKATEKVLRFVVYGSFVTAKENPNDVDVFMLMEDDFRPDDVLERAV